MIIIGIPVWVGRKLHARYRPTGKHKRMGIITGGVLASVSAYYLDVYIFIKQAHIINDRDRKLIHKE